MGARDWVGSDGFPQTPTLVLFGRPDAFVAWSYPPDTFGLTEQAIIQDLDVKMYYTAVATCFPAFKQMVSQGD